MDSSTDSESEVSPRWSDTSNMECGSSAAETKSVPRTRPRGPKVAERHDCYSMFLDPYDGSSEDSDASVDEQGHRPTRQLGRWCVARNRRPPHPPPQDLPNTVAMETLTSSASCGRPPDLLTEQEDAETCTDAAEDSALGGEGLGSSETSPSPSNLHKRKLSLPFGADLLQLGQKKLRQCALSMEVDSETQL